VNAKNGKGSATLSMAYAGARLGKAVLAGLNGTPTTECAYVMSDVEKDMPYFTSKVTFGKQGVEKVHPIGKLNQYEEGRLAEAKAALKKEILETTIELQRSSELRVKANKEFQSAIADQKATQSILKKALDRLGKFYAEQFVQLKAKHRHTLKQEPGAAAPPPPPSPTAGEYKSNGGAGSVMTMIEGIITDAKNMEKESIQGEQDATDAYHSFLKESFASIEAAQRAVTNKVEEKATAESAKTGAEGDKADAESTKEALAQTRADLHSSCDYIMDNFDAREMARKSETESLQKTLAQLKTS